MVLGTKFDAIFIFDAATGMENTPSCFVLARKTGKDCAVDSTRTRQQVAARVGGMSSRRCRSGGGARQAAARAGGGGTRRRAGGGGTRRRRGNRGR